jgi:hypothetical protein
MRAQLLVEGVQPGADAAVDHEVAHAHQDTTQDGRVDAHLQVDGLTGETLEVCLQALTLILREGHDGPDQSGQRNRLLRREIQWLCE